MIRAFTGWDVVYIVLATQWTIVLSLIAFAGGGTVGAIVAFARTSRSTAARWIAAFYISFFQGTPLLLQLFVAFFIPSSVGIQIAPLAAAAIGLSLNAGAFLGEIWRGAIEAVPKGQWEAASALGLRRGRALRLVIVPQALRMAIPPTVGFLVQLIKATSLAAIIGFTELTRSGQILINSTFRPFLIFSIIAVIYFLLCWPLSRAAAWLEQRNERGTDRLQRLERSAHLAA
ncbi:amino acid ABC transporter permease [Bosea sp. (in: a-proteobacteria)]|uniref:amino acid ABC transporter permease n=1 Tax=Bosea sp. (in: a-proteobacteria) TaxID=1871050 RepID=UPI0026278829|nr:amino acid ABC transporter permease [Bosea sp. (in: a-proteobacteria)]MCO5089817.1 amino acid ABC transporter permease [Bosea sp. (in: a-proteobacteria)]